jgi:integrase
MQSLVQEYLEERRRCGFALASPGFQLMAFARFADQSGHRGPLTQRLILDWVQGQRPSAPHAAWAARLKIIGPFAKYRARFDSRTEIPDLCTFGKAPVRITPHVFTEQEIADLLAAARAMRPRGKLRPVLYETLFGLLAATGLRISEALRLRYADIDAAQGTLTVRQTKFAKSRLVPLHTTVCEALQRYTAVRQLFAPVSQEAFLFVSRSGARLSRGDRALPRIHDLRHTFICRRILRWYQQGADVDNRMPALSTYVGHACVSCTYWYLTGIPELMAVAAKNFEQFADKSRKERHA